MAYNEFTLERVEAQFGLTTDSRTDYFANAGLTPIRAPLREHLEKRTPLALAIGTEKARSELLIMPVLLEALDLYGQECSLFSGVEFSPDPENGLHGVCDFLLSLSPEQWTVKAPVVAVVEAKNDNIKSGVGQCVAEMLAAQRFNAARGMANITYGVVTTGTNWQFLRLLGTTVYIERTEYYLKEVEKIVGILLAMLQEAAQQTTPVQA